MFRSIRPKRATEISCTGDRRSRTPLTVQSRRLSVAKLCLHADKPRWPARAMVTGCSRPLVKEFYLVENASCRDPFQAAGGWRAPPGPCTVEKEEIGPRTTQ
jgi:hypothetical protein